MVNRHSSLNTEEEGFEPPSTSHPANGFQDLRESSSSDNTSLDGLESVLFFCRSAKAIEVDSTLHTLHFPLHAVRALSTPGFHRNSYVRRLFGVGLMVANDQWRKP